MSANILTAKERCIDIIERFPQERLNSLADSLEVMFKMIDDAADEAFCAALVDRHEARADKYEQGISIEDLAAELGITLDTKHED